MSMEPKYFRKQLLRPFWGTVAVLLLLNLLVFLVENRLIGLESWQIPCLLTLALGLFYLRLFGEVFWVTLLKSNKHENPKR